jgi:hypothetical protein
MIQLLASVLIASQPDVEQINKFCSRVVGIAYASDNFTDEEWNRFTYCRDRLTTADKVRLTEPPGAVPPTFGTRQKAL